MNNNVKYDVIVVGGGHAGIEAAMASAGMGCRTLLLTMNLDAIGQMSCNPSVGGVGKGHLVREVDALGGQMGKATDETGIQFRMLNTRKGPAVQAPRAQCDKKAYQLRMKHAIESTENLSLAQANVLGLTRASDGSWSVRTSVLFDYLATTVVLTTGTFLRGLLHVGDRKLQGGRLGDSAASQLSKSLLDLGIELQRLKTGTSPRLLRKTIRWEACEIQPGDVPAPRFSFSQRGKFHVEQVPCYLTYTTPKTAEVIKKNISRSPLYSGVISGVGPRYCPSIEDKIIRFVDKERHQIYLEPEGRYTDEIYVNGASTSMPFDVQCELIHSIIGLEDAAIIRPAYAVEYDFAPPTQLHPWLESKTQPNLFFAGQINGTTGYEEAAAQGLIAGINAALKVKGKTPFVLRRDEAYIGVLIDDLITKGAAEPYRMFTSRAEHRLLLRQDNADLRLSEHGYRLGLVSSHDYQITCSKRRKICDTINMLQSSFRDGKRLLEILRRPETSIHDLDGTLSRLDQDVALQVEISVKYEGYITKQMMEISKMARLERTRIPETFDFDLVPSLRTEARQKLTKIKPHTLGQASRIQGVTPADIAVLSVWLKRKYDS